VAIFKWSSSVDYTSLSSWVAANQGTLSRPIVAQMWNDRPGSFWNGPFVVSGIVSGPTTGVTITAAPGESFADHPDRPLGMPNPVNGVALNQSANYSRTLYSNTNFFTITRLQVINNGGGNNCQGIYLLSRNGTTEASGNIICDNGHHDSAPLLNSAPPGSEITAIVTNNTFPWRNVAKVNGEARGTGGARFSAATRFENNTFMRPSNYGGGNLVDFCLGGVYNAHRVTIRNNAAFNYANDFGFPPYPPSQLDGVPDGHNATDNANFGVACTSVTVGNLTNVPFSAVFRHTANDGNLDLRLAVGSPLRGAGSSSGPATDIFGTVRPVGAFDIGAYQSTGAAQGVRLPSIVRPGVGG
jgi:hypothetical protein